MDIDLSGILTPAALARLRAEEAKTKAGRKKTKYKPAVPLPVNLKPVPSPWEATAAVLVTSVVTCACGAVHSIPAADTPLVRFVHKRNGTIWEVANHPSLLRANLPRETRTLESTTQACRICWKGERQGQDQSLDWEEEYHA